MKRFITLFFLIGMCIPVNAQSVELVDFSHSQCDEPVSDYTIRVRIISKTLESDTFKLSIGFAWGCCMQFNGIAEMKNDTLHVSLKRKTEDYCFCTCCYQSDFKIVGIKNVDIPIKFYDKVIEYSPEKYATFSPKYDIVKGDTLNYIDKYGLKQGKWFDFEKNFRIYTNNRLTGWGRELQNGNIEEYNSRTDVTTTYSKKGKVLKRSSGN
jgi:hypothetical protein